MTSFGRRPQNIKSGISQQPFSGSYSNLKPRLRQPPQNIKSGKSQQPLIGSYSNFKLKLRLPKIEFTNP